MSIRRLPLLVAVLLVARLRAVVAVLLVAGLAACSSPADAPTAPLRDGHVDVGPALIDGRWSVGLKDATGWRDPAGVLLVVGDAARSTLPPAGEHAFLGRPGDPVWLIPQTQRSGVPWLGWNTQHEGLTAVTLSLHDVEGPGDLRVYFDYGGFRAPEVVWDSTATERPLEVAAGTHAHANWAFSAPGSYSAELTATIGTAAGSRVTATGTLRFAVGP